MAMQREGGGEMEKEEKQNDMVIMMKRGRTGDSGVVRNSLM